MGDDKEAPDGRIYRQCKAISLNETYWNVKPVVDVNVPCLQRGRHLREHCKPPATSRILR
jgi:hypothetical protein